MIALIFAALLGGTSTGAIPLHISQELTTMDTVPGFAHEDFRRALRLFEAAELEALWTKFAKDVRRLTIRVSGEELLQSDWRYSARRTGRTGVEVANYALTGPAGPLTFALLLDRASSHRDIGYDDGSIQFVTRSRVAHAEVRVFSALLYLAFVLAPLEADERPAEPRFDFELPMATRARHLARYREVLDEVVRLNPVSAFSAEQLAILSGFRDEVRDALTGCEDLMSTGAEAPL